MTRRQRQEDKTLPWVVGFAGSASKTNKDNVKELLNVFIPIDQDIEAVIPTSIKRTQKTLMAAWNWLDGDQGETDTDLFEPYPYEKTEDIVSYLITAQQAHHQVYLVLAYDEAKDFAIARDALDAGIPVKDLTSGMDDLQISAPEEEEQEEQPTKQRGQPRGQVVQAEVTGPATVVTHEPISTPIAQIERALRVLIREEIAQAAAYGFVEDMSAKLSEPVKAFTNEDGEYELAGDRKRAPRGWKAVELTATEAEDLKKAGKL